MPVNLMLSNTAGLLLFFLVNICLAYRGTRVEHVPGPSSSPLPVSYPHPFLACSHHHHHHHPSHLPLYSSPHIYAQRTFPFTKAQAHSSQEHTRIVLPPLSPPQPGRKATVTVVVQSRYHSSFQVVSRPLFS
ncbi:hypothetical protein BDQ17DRAFT_187583 [Cyathus striatus]|nr:hypothetical protein BDQ17DRAFT_187583 [Cyathus striatus]